MLGCSLFLGTRLQTSADLCVFLLENMFRQFFRDLDKRSTCLLLGLGSYALVTAAGLTAVGQAHVKFNSF